MTGSLIFCTWLMHVFQGLFLNERPPQNFVVQKVNIYYFHDEDMSIQDNSEST